MTVRPISFQAPMIRALLDGRKTQTRRLKFKAEPGDLLWVRETWAAGKCAETLSPACLSPGFWRHENGGIWYAAGGDPRHPVTPRGKWRPSIYMPRWASRITLEVTEVRRERLQDITDDDAKAEGIRWSGRSEGYSYDPEDGGPGYHRSAPRESFLKLWNSINGKRPGAAWADNPLVTAISFRVHRCNVDDSSRAGDQEDGGASPRPDGDHMRRSADE